jgi:hypothetical protein
LLEFTELADPPDKALFAGEVRSQKSSNQLLGKLCSDNPCTQAQHIHIVVLYTLVGRIRIMA